VGSDRRITTYVVIRTRDLFGYQEYLGPMVSCFRDRAGDARRLYGLRGHTLECVPVERLTDYQRACLERDQADRVALGLPAGGENDG
jgi:hypothetical protein